MTFPAGTPDIWALRRALRPLTKGATAKYPPKLADSLLPVSGRLAESATNV